MYEHLTDEECTQGFARLDADVAADSAPEPVESDSDLLVIRTLD